MHIRFDHLVIGAQRLEQGVAYVREVLGVDMPPGGKHPRMGTHNHVLRVGEQSFLEVIAIDPEARAPARKRWFGLDEPALQNELAHAPRLIHWVVGTPDLPKSLAQSSLDLGKAELMTRGSLEWLISIREDGVLVEQGLVPTLIQWPEGPHPAERMTSAGLHLEEIQLYHPEPERLRRLLSEIGTESLGQILSSSDSFAYIKAIFRDLKGDAIVLG